MNGCIQGNPKGIRQVYRLKNIAYQTGYFRVKQTFQVRKLFPLDRPPRRDAVDEDVDRLLQCPEQVVDRHPLEGVAAWRVDPHRNAIVGTGAVRLRSLDRQP